MTTRAAVVLAGLALAAAGLVLGLIPQSTAGVSCGSAFHRTDKAETADLTAAILADNGGPQPGPSVADRCDDATTSRRIPAIVLLVVGGVLAAGAGLAGTVGAPEDRPAL